MINSIYLKIYFFTCSRYRKNVFYIRSAFEIIQKQTSSKQI